MSEPKSFEQVLREWRETGKAAKALDCLEFTATVATGETLTACADEAQPILDKLREIVEKFRTLAGRAMEQTSDRAEYAPSLQDMRLLGKCDAYGDCADELERTLGEREK